MKNISFENIYYYGEPVFENELYVHIHHAEVPLMYDSNFIKFKKMPLLKEFKQADNYLRTFHFNNGQKHVKYTFPENQKLTSELINYFAEFHYFFNVLELYAIDPHQFPKVSEHPEIHIQKVTKENLRSYLKFQYEQDSIFGTDYAAQKQTQHRKNFTSEMIIQILAYYQGNPAGSVDVILANETAEIDNLTVQESLQKRGIGSRIQKFIMEQYHDKVIILVANGDDTPKEMYKKQNYRFLGYKLEILKIFK